jgi:hypothetical protein
MVANIYFLELDIFQASTPFPTLSMQHVLNALLQKWNTFLLTSYSASYFLNLYRRNI